LYTKNRIIFEFYENILRHFVCTLSQIMALYHNVEHIFNSYITLNLQGKKCYEQESSISGTLMGQFRRKNLVRLSLYFNRFRLSRPHTYVQYKRRKVYQHSAGIIGGISCSTKQ